ncbi:hypothetical protein F4809DRAFT_591776 [Biscogniauxia mediterranea]|nr:hypothetical protein F4809DRAFT_591776 [Biscogniauxia mediterranea]
MAPVTRGRSNADKRDGTITSPMSERGGPSFQSIDEPIKTRGKRKSMGDLSEEKDAGDATPNAKLKTPKRQRLAVQTTEERTASGGRRKQIKAEMPSSATKRGRSSHVAGSQEDRGDSSDEIEIEPTSASKQLMEEASQQLASRALDPVPTPRPKPKSKHVVFGDDDDVEKFVAEGAEIKKDLKETPEEAESGNDDDAPEAVSTQAAAKERLKSAQAAAEAAEKHAASLKRKRQEKDNLFKQQAEKRKHTRIEESTSQQPAKSLSAAGSEQDEAAAAAAAAEAKAEKPTAGRRRAEKHKLPDVLPSEFLTDSSSESDDDTALQRVLAKKPKKITFDAAAQALGKDDPGAGKQRPPRDEIVGATRFRVLAAQGDEKLAPRAHKNARLVKEDLLRRRRTAVVPNKKKGFFLRR